MADGGRVVEGDEGRAGLDKINGTNLWPRRRWVDTDRGWASREANGMDARRRALIERLLSKGEPDKQAIREEIESLDAVLADWDQGVRDQPVFEE